MKSKFQRKDFYGTVVTKEWVRGLDGNSYNQVTGVVSVFTDEEIVGFKVRGTDSNWMARVEGEDEAWNILGCQIRAIIAHEKSKRIASRDALVLV